MIKVIVFNDGESDCFSSVKAVCRFYGADKNRNLESIITNFDLWRLRDDF